MTFLFAAEAEAELREAAAYYAERASVALADAFLGEVLRCARLVAGNPGLGTPTLGGRRIFPLRRFPYSLIYRTFEGGVRIAAIAHQSRRPGYWRQRR